MDELCTKEIRLKAGSLDVEKRYCEFVASTADIDSYGEIVEQVWNLARFLSNPVILFAHNSRELPIGKAVFCEVQDGQLVCGIEFLTAAENPLAENVFQCIKSGALRAVSVGFIAHSYRWEKRGDQEILILSDNELFEISVTPTPANANALIRSKAIKERNLKVDKELLDKILKMLGISASDELVPSIAALVSATKQVETLAKENKDLKDKADQTERNEILASAKRASKITPDDEEDPEHQELVKSMTTPQLRLWAKRLKAKIPTQEIESSEGNSGSSETAKTKSGVKVVLSKYDERLIERHGLDRDKFIAQRQQDLEDAQYEDVEEGEAV